MEMSINERFDQSIKLGESQFREFKSVFEGREGSKQHRNTQDILKDISHTLVGFANAEGGELYVGVEDDGHVSGLHMDQAKILEIMKNCDQFVHKKTPIKNIVKKLIIDSNDNTILFFSVEKSLQMLHQTSDGKCLVRRGTSTDPEIFKTIQFERQEQKSREYDRQYVEKAMVNDLNTALINDTIVYKTGQSVEKSLNYFNLGNYYDAFFHLRRAAILLFANNIDTWHPRCEVRIVRVDGLELKTALDYNIKQDDTIRGNIIEIHKKAWEVLRPYLVQGYEFDRDTATFKETKLFPEGACQEALVNAIYHRDYSIEGRGIEIYIYNNRMEIVSPGGLLSSISIDDIRNNQGKHDSRNPFVARILKEIGVVREMGEGIKRIYQLIKEAQIKQPEFYTSEDSFKVILYNETAFSTGDKMWLEGYNAIKLEMNEKKLVLLGKTINLLSTRKIMDELGIIDTDKYRAFIDQARTKGIVFYTINNRANLNNTAKKLGISSRDVKRIGIRKPEEIQKSLQELFDVIQELGPTDIVNNDYYIAFESKISKDNIYRWNFTHFRNLMQILGLIDIDNRPTPLLINYWKKKRD